jgi:hypothetical protein
LSNYYKKEKEEKEMRNLCTIQTIKSMENIEGKDRIKLASFESVGWKVIVSTEQKVGGKVVYCEPDTLLPVKPEFEFLRKRCFKESWNGFVIKRMKMANVFSEGLAIPISEIPDLKTAIKNKWKDDTDVTEDIGAKKYDPELLEEQNSIKSKKYNWFQKLLFRIPFMKRLIMGEKTSKAWPSFISKTDETRIQNLNYLFNDAHKGIRLDMTEKLDGQSSTFGLIKGYFYVCSRNMCVYKEKVGKIKKKKPVTSKFVQTAIDYEVENKLSKVGHDVYIQCEQMGPGIQKNKYGLTKTDIYVFNVFDCELNRYLVWEELDSFCKKYGFQSVPYVGSLMFMFNNIDEIIPISKGMSVLNPNVPREGIVLRASVPTGPEKGMSNMFSFKIINPDFLIKYGMDD